MSFISTRVSQFAYFDIVLGGPRWRGERVLDFGGNAGNMLRGAGDAIDHDRYWCVDLSRDALAKGRRDFPDAHFVYYDRYSFEYNPCGDVGRPIPIGGQQFDVIVAFSVFTHIAVVEMRELVRQLRTALAPRGVLAFTFYDPTFDPATAEGYEMPTYGPGARPGTNLETRLEKDCSPGVDVSALLAGTQGARRLTLINDVLHVDDDGDGLYNPREGGKYVCLYQPAYVAEQFPGCSIHPPVSPETQHCCVIRRP